MRLSQVCGHGPLTALALAAAVLVTACGGGSSSGGGSAGGTPTPPGSNEPQLAYKAEIRRTGMGVPHIKADDWGGAGYGYGYAQAQDDLCTMANSFLTYRGERSLHFGGDALIPFSSTIGRQKNIDSDFFHRHVLNDDVVKAMIAAQPETIRSMVSGFAAGYNRYVREIKAGGDASAHAACRGEAWVAPVTSDDIFRRMYAANFAGGYSNFLPNIANAIAPAAVTPTVAMLRRQRAAQATQLASAPIKTPDFEVGGHEGVGSNMIGFGTAATGDSSPLLFGNPHWYWRGPDRFYQAQLTIPGKLNVSGTSFLGIPVILIGFNENVAWSHTVSTARRFGFFQLTLASGDPTSYMRDGQAVKMKARSITVQVKQAAGGLSPVTRTLYESEYGPMVNLGLLNPGFAWSQTMAFAIRDVNGDNFRLFRNWQRWNQAKSLDEFAAIQREEAAIPWVNTVAVGRGSAKAWYADIGAIPNAPGSSCNAAVAPMLAPSLPRVPVLDGSKSACDWQSDADSVQKGALGPTRMPSLQRDDYVANMNDSYWLSNPAQPLTGYPAIMGPAGSEAVSFRTRLGNLLAKGRLAGTDGYTGQYATSETVRKMVLNSRVYTAELFKADAMALICAAGPITVSGQTVDPTAACAVLGNWDNTGTRTSRGALLWDEFWTRASRTSSLYAVPFDAADPVNTPRQLKTDGTITAALQQAFGAAVLAVQASSYPLDAQRGDYLYATRGGQKIPLYGGCGGQGYFTIACSETPLSQGGYSMDNDPNGNSYMQVVRFPAGGVEAHTFLTFSLSDDPASAHNADYTRAYSEGQWHKVPFSEAEIAGDPALKLTSISE